jgi:hypothetical protein
MNIDHCNSHSSFIDKVEMSNLCQEITLPTKPLQHIDDTDGEIALCILSAVNVGKLKSLDELEPLCDLSVRSLDELIDFQGYPVKAAENATRARRSLGVGFIGLAHYLAKHGEHYDDPGAWKLVHDLTEAFQYYLIQATVNLAKEKGACEYSHRTKYGQGILPIDTYKKDVDEIVSNELKYDWESLRAQVLQGTQHCPHRCLRRAVPLCQMQPTGSNLLVDTCPLRSRRRVHSSRLFLSIKHLRIIIRFCGICLAIVGIFILLLLCKSSLIKRFLETGPIIQSITQIMKFLLQ